MKSIFIAIACIAISMSSAPSWAVNKCTASDGKVTFQEAPCEGKPAFKSSVVGTVTPNTATAKQRPPMGDPEYEKAREAERAKQIDAYAKTTGAALAADLQAIEAKCGKGSLEPFVGASAQWIRKCSWGDPESVSTISNALGKSEQWRYKTKGTLFFDSKGQVTTIFN